MDRAHLEELLADFHSAIRDMDWIESIHADCAIRIFVVCDDASPDERRSLHEREMDFMRKHGRGFDFRTINRYGEPIGDIVTLDGLLSTSCEEESDG